MMYKAKVALCSEISTKPSTQGEHNIEFFNIKLGGTYRKPLGFKSLNLNITFTNAR